MKLHYLLLGIILFFGFFFRFWNLQAIPTGLNQDETSIGYDAYSILQTKRDQHGKKFPLYFESFGDYKLPGYIYATALSEKIFGVNDFAVRFTSALAGFLSVILIYFLTFDIVKKKQVALLSSFLLAFNPWSIFLSRAGFEVNVAVSLIMLGAVFFYLSLKKPLSWLFLLLSVLSFAASTYMYNVTRLSAPTILIFLIFSERKNLFVKVNKYFVAFLFLLFMIIISPFFLTLPQGSGLQAQKNVLIFGGESLAGILNFRSALVDWPQIVVKLAFNTPMLLFYQYVKNLISSLNPAFFFVSIDPDGTFGIPGTGAFYFIELLTVLLAVLVIVKRRIKSMYVVLIWFILLVLIVGLSALVPRSTRSFGQIIPLTILSAYGLNEMCTRLLSQKNNVAKYLGLFLISVGFIYGIFYFLVSYFVIFPKFYSDSWRPGEKELSNFIMENSNSSDRILFDSKVDFIYTSLLFYGKFPPEEFQKTVIWEPDKGIGFRRIKSFGKGSKYRFQRVDWAYAAKFPNSILIMPLDFNDNSVKPAKVVSGMTRTQVIPENGTFSSGVITPVYFRAYKSNDYLHQIRSGKVM